MSEKPQEDRPEDLLEQIFTQGLEKIKAPPQATDPEDAPPEIAAVPDPEDGEGPAPAADRKSRSFAVTPYLLILFGAAFLALLLAYFVQQRNSKELKDRNAALEEQAEALSRELESWKAIASNWEDSYNAAVQDANNLLEALRYARVEANSWQSFWELEQFYRAEDLRSCAAVLLKQALSQPAYNGLSEYTYQTPDGMDRRYEEIVRAVVGAGILDWDYERHLEDYMELLNG